MGKVAVIDERERSVLKVGEAIRICSLKGNKYIIIFFLIIAVEANVSE